jgi:hypothetical protein
VPENFRTVELCLEAVKQNDRTMQSVPKALRAEVRAALKNTAHIGLK